MVDIPFTPPTYKANGFNCPYSDCRAYADQYWGTILGQMERGGNLADVVDQQSGANPAKFGMPQGLHFPALAAVGFHQPM
ncbi:MAG TPA: hypothetical protein VND87_09650 [Stellaceae bacterium]|nr:hypothetical protein [Stellaceae bacterium]